MLGPGSFLGEMSCDPTNKPNMLPSPGANKEGLAVAKAAGGNFIRAEGFVFSHVADEGWMDACAGDLLRYRKTIGAEDVLIFTDIKKKHRWVVRDEAGPLGGEL